jgi:hypothetical protein
VWNTAGVGTESSGLRLRNGCRLTDFKPCAAAGKRRFGMRGDADGLFHGLRPPPDYRLKNPSPLCPHALRF